VHLLSPAKINLHLRVGPPAADGFHPLMSWFCTVGLFDSIEMDRLDEPEISLTSNWNQIPTDQTNLVIRAAHALLSHTGQRRGARIQLTKTIPVGGGLGGGSSNAAATLRGLNDLWDLRLRLADLGALAEKLGSDVPFFLHGPSSICTGRGQFVKPISGPMPRYAVLIFPKISIATPGVYKRFDQLGLGVEDAIDSQPTWSVWAKLSARELLPLLVNDLEAPAFALHPELDDLRRQIERSIGQFVRMSGSGSTLFTLADDQTHAAEIAKSISEKFIPARAVQLCPAMTP
jgi:4-diphosphocytidyl-2-C-methyl-D-erythritol kinase